MKILIYSLMSFSAVLALVTGGLSIILGWMFRSSISDSDVLWGWGFIIFGILYIAHPCLIYWLFCKGFLISSILVGLFFIAFSIGLIFFLPAAIEAGSRP